jgi:hypothetical protein
MCRAAHIGEETCETIGELRAKIGELIMMDEKRLVADSNCLCWVDMQTTAAKHGYELTTDPCDYFLTKKQGANA